MAKGNKTFNIPGLSFHGKGPWVLQMQNKSSLVKQVSQLQNQVWNAR